MMNFRAPWATALRLPLAICLTALLYACGDDTPASTITPDPATAPLVDPTLDHPPVPRFDADSAYAYVARQVAFGPRVMNTPAHAAAEEWLVGELERHGATVERQDFKATAYTGTTLDGTNIIGRFRPDLVNRVVLAAHWDTRHVADSDLETDPEAVVNGADDGASGVGVLLEIARQLGRSTPHLGVDIVFFDAEDYGSSEDGDSWGLGAQHYSRNMSNPRPRYGILLDMVGAEGATFAREGVSMAYAGFLVDKVWKLAQTMKFGQYFVDTRGKSVTDDHYFVNSIAKVPMIDIINYRPETETGFVTHWHTGDDDMDKIDRETLRAVGQVVTAVVYREGAGTL